MKADATVVCVGARTAVYKTAVNRGEAELC
jgi:hypothetical protein